MTLAAFTAWAWVQLIVLIQLVANGGDPMAPLWVFALVLLWWVPVSWLEQPVRLTSTDSEHIVAGLRVAVQIPVYNEDEAALHACLQSVLDQSRAPDRVFLVDDGSMNGRDGTPLLYTDTRTWFLEAAAAAGVDGRWSRTANRGKRFAQMSVLADDDSDVFVTVDSDSVLDHRALEEGVKPFQDWRVTSVAGSILVLNERRNALTTLICALYLPFTRGFRSAQSVIGQVMVNSGTLAFYRASSVRRRAKSYVSETFAGRPMQMNDDSMLTFYAMLDGRTVHQPSCFAFTLVPETWPHYRNQALRWMRGTFIRTLWWVRYMSPKSPAFWMPIAELAQLLLGVVFVIALVSRAFDVEEIPRLLRTAGGVALAMNYLIGLRWFTVRRDDEPRWFRMCVYLLTPVAGLWRVVVLRPLQLYAIATCWRVSSWGTRGQVEVHVVG